MDSMGTALCGQERIVVDDQRVALASCSRQIDESPCAPDPDLRVGVLVTILDRIGTTLERRRGQCEMAPSILD
jgi:hypothetical protein